MSEFSGDATHPASPIRREQARRDGDAPKSYELANAIHLIGGLAAAFLLLGGIGSWIRNWTISQWQGAGTNLSLDAAATTTQLQSTTFSFAAVLAPLMALMLVLGILSHWSQTGLVFRPQQVVPDMTRLGPNKWWQHIFSTNLVSIPFVGLPKTLVAGWTAITSFWLQRGQVFELAALPAEQLVESLFGLVLAVSFHVAVVLFLLSLIDYGLKRWSFEKRIRMTDQQLRDEARMQTGDPTVVAQRRQLHQSYGRES